MKLPKVKPYAKKLEYSYVYGVFPTLELFRLRPESVMKVIFHSKAFENVGNNKIDEFCEANGIHTEINDKAIQRISQKENTYVVTMYKKFESKLEEANHIVLYNPRNMGNMGTIIRTMLGLGFNNLAMIRPAADIFNPRVSRATMGAIFDINFEYFDTIVEYQKRFGNNLYVTSLQSSKDIREVTFKSPYSLVFGNEGLGVPDEVAALGQAIKIPQTSDIDSLNLSVAAGITMWEAYNQTK